MKRVLVLNGPNLNLLGRREPEVYGSTTLAEIEDACVKEGAALGMAVECRQSNHEGELVEWVQEAKGMADAIVLNAGAYSHTSIALLDALRFFGGTVVEVHVSNIFAREEYRRHSVLSEAARGVISGLGWRGYVYALRFLAEEALTQERG